jgi:hypothetical protein
MPTTIRRRKKLKVQRKYKRRFTNNRDLESALGRTIISE